MAGESMSNEEIAAVLQANDIDDKEAVTVDEPAAASPIQGESLPVLVPAEVYTELREEPFLCWDTGSWAYTAQGVLLNGRWPSDPETVETPEGEVPFERDLLVPHERVIGIELLFEIISRYNDNAREAIEADVEDAKEEADGDGGDSAVGSSD